MSSADDQRVAAALNKALEQLQTAIEEQERAANQILGQAERLLDKHDPKTLPMIASAIMEACSFQDITGQRINKVARLIRYLRDQKIVGTGDLPQLKPKPPEPQGLSQADIDKLLNGG